jgi:alkanesulfonate monooxygenase SsuD/methylene tetrahydromethanopterin reductase-like flavin-dependent oxidoreductase (luciferase family)
MAGNPPADAPAAILAALTWRLPAARRRQLSLIVTPRTLPIWMAGNPPADAPDERVRRVLDRVARLGDGWLTFAVTPGTLRRRLEVLTELRASLGRPPGDDLPVCVFLNVNVNPDADRALDDALATWRRQSTRNVSADQLRSLAALGSPEQGAEAVAPVDEAVEQLAALADDPRREPAGCDEIGWLMV